MINLFQPYVPHETSEAVAAALNSRYLAQSAKVDLFEKEFSTLFNVDYPVSVNSGTSALETAYDLIGLKEGDEVITTPLTCTATNIPLLQRKVKIVWADICTDTLCIDHTDIRRKVTNKTKAIVQVHLGGVMSDFDHPSLPVVSDACQALGVFTGDYTACSFQAIKHITTGDGGMIVLNNKDEYRKAKLMRWFGIDRERIVKNEWQSYRTRMMSFDIEMLGYKRHMNDICATIGLVGLKHYHKNVEYRKYLFNIYKNLLSTVAGIKVVDGSKNVCWLCTVLVENRDGFAKKLYEKGVETNLVQVRNDRYKIFCEKQSDLPNLATIEDKYISLSIGMHVKETDVENICSVIKSGW